MTKVQKFVLTKIAEHGGRLRAYIGKKQTMMAVIRDTQEPIICLSVVVIYGLTGQDPFIQVHGEKKEPRYLTLTERGKECLGL